MDFAGMALLVTAGTAAVGGAIAGVAKLWKSSVQNAVLSEQAKATVDAKNRESAEKDKVISNLQEENQKLWRLLDGVTK